MFLIGLITRTGTCQVKENKRKHWLIKDQQLYNANYNVNQKHKI